MQVSEVLHVAIYFGCPNLASHCEQRLERVLLAPEVSYGGFIPSNQLPIDAETRMLPHVSMLSLSCDE